MQNLSDTATRMWATLTHPDQIRGLLVGYFRDSKDQAVKLLQSSGVAISQTAPMKDVQIAYLKAVKDSDAFRAKAAASLTGYATSVKSGVRRAYGTHNMSSFVDNARADGYFNAVSVADQFGQISDQSSISIDASTANAAMDQQAQDNTIVPGYANTGNVSLASIPGGASSYQGGVAVNPGPAPSSSGGGFWASLGSVFTPTVIQSGIQTGLKAISTNITANANKSSELNALQLEQLKLAQAQTAAQAAALNPMGTGTKILIGVGVGAAVIATIVLIMRHKRKAA